MESNFSDTIKWPAGTLNELVGLCGHNKSPKAGNVREHKAATVDLGITTPAFAGGTVPGTFLELNADFVSHSSPGLCYTLLESLRFLWSTCFIEVHTPELISLVEYRN